MTKELEIRTAAAVLAARSARLQYHEECRNTGLVDVEKQLVEMARSKLEELILEVPEPRRAGVRVDVQRLIHRAASEKLRNLGSSNPFPAR
jgi:hypothetical protein